MDKKTMIKVINGMAEKIEKLEKINLLNADRNIKNMEHFETIVGKIDVLEDNLITLKNSVCDRLIMHEGNIESLENKVKYNESFNHDEDKIEALEDNIKTLNNKISGLQWDTAQDTDKLNGRFDEVFNYFKRRLRDVEFKMIAPINDRCDDLEAKNFQIKSDLDKLILDKLISDNPVEFPTIAQNPKYKRKGAK